MAAERQLRRMAMAFFWWRASTCPHCARKSSACRRKTSATSRWRSFIAGPQGAGNLDYVERVQQFQGANRGAYGQVGDVQVARGGLRFGMAEQDLNGAEIHARFQQVRGESVPQGVRMDRFADARGSSGLLAHPENRWGADGLTGLVAGKQPVCGLFPPPIGAE